VVYQYLKLSDADGESYQLFNLADDPFKSTNLADQRSDQLRLMTVRLSTSLQQNQAQHPFSVDDSARKLMPQIPEVTKVLP